MSPSSAQGDEQSGAGDSGQTDLSYYSFVNPPLLEMTPLDVQVVVDVGCGAGAQGALYKQKNPSCRYIGIERFAPAAEVARQRLDHVLMADVEQLDDEQLDFKGQVDCLVYGDVLEHLIDPWRALRQHCGWLRTGGRVVASIPNVGHLRVILGLLAGKWKYEDRGLLDRTHLRFFTLESMMRLFSQAGLTVAERRAYVLPHPDVQQCVQVLTPLLQRLGRDVNQFLTEASVHQYFFRAIKQETGALGQPQAATPEV